MSTSFDTHDRVASYDNYDQPNALITAEKVSGTDVYNEAEERLGTIDSIVIDKFSGEVAYVVMSFGGFLGIGEKFHPLPWDVLEYDTKLGGYRVDLDRDDLIDAPAYDRGAIDSYDFDRDAGGIGNFYVRKSRLARDIPDDADGSDHVIDSDSNDGRRRPLGYYSSQAQADRSRHEPGATPVDNAAGGPGFYSAAQQTSRNLDPAARDFAAVRGGVDGDTGTELNSSAEHAGAFDSDGRRDR